MRPIFQIPLGAAFALVSLHPLHAQPGAGFNVDAGGITNVSPITVADAVTLTITCAQGVDCAGLDVEVVNGANVRQTASLQQSAQGAFSVIVTPQMLGGAPARLLVSGGGTAGGEIPLVPGTAQRADGNGNDTPTVSVTRADVGAMLTRDCSALGTITSPLYDAQNNLARFVVTPVGNVLHRPGDVIDENDKVIVYVVGDSLAVSRLAVTRISDFRTPDQASFLGEGLSIADALKAARGDSTRRAPPCVRREFTVTDLAPGKKGEIQLALVDEKGERAEVGKFDFGVHTLYSGAFSFGPVWTQLRDPEIGTVTRSGKEVVTSTEDGTPRVMYVLSFTPFMWARRELEEPGPWYTHVNPTIGIVPAHLQDNAIVGLSIDVLNSFFLQGGVHAGRVRRLDPRTGLHVGDEFTGTGDVPTVKEWDADWFVGLTVDLRAAVEFLRIAATGAGGG